ncbi:CPBP family intramembrane glutamic endopeptidase [uncultured Erythrobacter sp.]|uniref:CPBP family intramembrane glutamic endopeptidase n=1 Tax=uncultured Erythrobacter sp. TaxID=263913 RepID=UPI002623D9ED|nr:CPBP family intramembrane glutamic endopeptidase [uncultured Erythrobacter sp.]
MSDMTTTPLSGPQSGPLSSDQAEAVFGDGRIADTHAAPAKSIGGEWRRFGAFLKRPNLDLRFRSEDAFTVLARIYVLDIAVMAALVGLASTLVAMGVYIPETALAGMEFTWEIILLVVVGAPVMEEIAFRGWLGGKPGPILALLLLGAGGLGFALVHASSPAYGSILAIAGIVGAGLALFLLRNRPTMSWFSRAFPLFFWFSTTAFALVHLANFDEGSLAILLPLVLPQFVLGMMLGYVRVRFALWAAILLHAAHNATAISIAALASDLS